MLAIDTNVFVRCLTGDHPIQSARAKALIEGEDVFVCTAVLQTLLPSIVLQRSAVIAVVAGM